MERIRDLLAWHGHQVYEVGDDAIEATAELARLRLNPADGPEPEAVAELVARLARRRWR